LIFIEKQNRNKITLLSDFTFFRFHITKKAEPRLILRSLVKTDFELPTSFH